MKIIIISGTPGCGKTSVANEISKLIESKIISLNELAISNNFSLEYDQKRNTYIVDFEVFRPYILKRIKKLEKTNPPFLILESHFSDIIPSNYLDFVFILRCDPDELYNRLKNRKYSAKKIIENIQAEILGNCVNYFIQKNIKVPFFEIDTTRININTVANIIVDIVLGKKDGNEYQVGKIDWLEKLDQENRLKDFFD
ncbi:MAG: adenylate kinase family protein [Candidatus Thorarchaeota archaeon]